MKHAVLSSIASRVVQRTPRAGLLALAFAAAMHAVVAGQQAGTNVNIVKGTSLPNGDPFLQRQTEPSVAVSTRNPCHLAASAVDYRTVDLEHPDDVNPTQLAAGDAWLGFYKSFDCGQRWQSHLIPGYRGDTTADGQTSPIRGFDAGADGVVRAGSNGLFYYVGMVFQRDQSASKVFVSRFIDSNNKERGDTIEFAGTSVVASGDATHFLDKPWIAVDIPRKALTLTDKGGDRDRGRDDDRDHDGVCFVNGQRVPAGNVYVGWTNFDVATTTETSRIMFARSATCGRTWQQRAIFEHRHARPAHSHESHGRDRDFDAEDEDNEANRVVQGAAIAIGPADGAVYVAWRQFARNGLPSGIYFSKSTDGGMSFSAPQQLALINGFDQERGLTTFRTNAMPTIAADQSGRVYVAWAERGFATAAGRADKLTGDSRIVLTVSPDRGRTWMPRYPIDSTYADRNGVRTPIVGHQVMPTLTVAAGKLHAMWYDFRDDPCITDASKAMQPSCGSTNGVANYQYVDGIDHLVNVQSATAAIGAQPAFTSVRMSQFPQSIDAAGKVHSRTSHANLPLYSSGTKSFLGDYIDASALTALPTRPSKNTQEWVPNFGSLTVSSARPDPGTAPMSGFTTLPIFHGVWTDMRDVRPPLNGDWTLYFPPKSPISTGAQCNPDTAGMRDANIYSSRVTPGVYVGSPGNAKPLGFTVRDGVRQHLQRAFVVFVQNPLRETRYYRLTIVNQPGPANTDRASFNQFPAPPFSAANPSDRLHDPRIAPVTQAWITVPPISTVARNVYVTAADATAQVRVDVEETMAPPPVTPSPPGQPAPRRPIPPLKDNGLRSSILLNPDPTSPPLTGPDVEVEVPDIAELEVHEPIVDDPIFFNINDPRSRSTELRTPADQNPADQNPADQNPADQNVGDLNPADQNPADQNPADQNPADQNAGVEAVAFGDDVTGTGTVVRDVHFPVRNSGNTTTRYFFRPVVSSTSPNRKYQLLVTVRNNTLTVDANCNLKFDPQHSVLVNVSDFKPRTPADQNPADQNPADQNPADQNPADQNPADQNPADQNPADQNTSFFLAPGDEATVTLRIYAPAGEADTLPTPGNNQVAAVVASASANTGETVAPSAAAGADLTALEPPATVNVPAVEPGTQVNLSWTLKNRGTDPAVAAETGVIRTEFYLSLNSTAAFTPGDVLLATASREGQIPPCTPDNPDVCAFAAVQPLLIPPATALGANFIKIISDPTSIDLPGGRVFEATKANNIAVVPIAIAVINDAPSFVKGPNQAMLPGAGAQTVEGWATNISAGPANEAGQTLSFIVSADNTALFAVQPMVSPGGTLTFTPATGRTGSANVTVQLHDNGGTAFGGADTSASQTFIISVTAVNDPPSFTRGADQTVVEDAGPQTVSNWATNISPGPADEAGQLVDFVVSTDNRALFASQPAISPAGTLTYSTAANANGIATVSVRLHDNGGTANGGVDSSAPQTFTITVVAVNDAPSFTKGADQTVSSGAGNQTVLNWATNISAGSADESAQLLAFVAAADNPALFATVPEISTAGTLTYAPAAGVAGTTTVTVRLRDNGGTVNGGIDTSAPQTFTITVAASAPTATDDFFSTFEDTRFPVSACTAPIAYSAFSANSPFLTEAGDASFTATDADGSVLRLISSFTPEGAFNFGTRGGAWTRPAISLSNLHTTFTFRMTGGAAPFAPDPSLGWDGQGLGPDGLVFMLQNSDAGVNALGGAGGALVTGITPSVGIEFDTFQSGEFSDPDSNHIGIDVNGSNVSVVTAPVATRFDDGSLWTAWVDYDGATLEVRASPTGVRPDLPTLSYPINLSAILGPSATAGFVAANGSNVANVDLVSWSSTCVTPNLLGNDTDPNERMLTASLVDQALHGTAVVNVDGTFSYTPDSDFFGGDSFTYKASNGTADSAPAIVTIVVGEVNDPPSFVKGADQTAAADGVAHTVPAWATAVSAGPANEAGQSAFFQVSNDNNPLFAIQPAVDTTGTLTFTPNIGVAGTAVVTVQARDNGGTLNGGINSSVPQTFTIVVTAVTTAPLALTTTTLRDGVVALENYTVRLSATGGRGALAFSVDSGTLPTGVVLNSDGSFSGVPMITGSFAFVASVTDCAASTCPADVSPQSATRALTLRVDARDQIGGSEPQPAITFGGVEGRRLAQVVTVGAHGSLVGVGLRDLSCPTGGPVTIAIERLTAAGLPDGIPIASGTTSDTFNTILVTPPVDLAIDAQFAFVISSPTACNLPNAPASDTYKGGDAYGDAGAGWEPLLTTDGRFDVGFRTLIQPARKVVYLHAHRGGLTATTLGDGRVMLTGNDNSAEIYDPSTDATTFTGTMSRPRSNHSATLLADGTVLIAGGRDFNGTRTATTEIYHPGDGTFAPGPSMSIARETHTATLLPDGRVLIAGGTGADGSTLGSAEIYDPVLAAFTNLGQMTAPRNSHTATLLTSGKVLLAGGYNNGPVTNGELFDPATNTFSATTGAMVVPFRGRATATLLPNGKVLIAGGQPGDVTSSAELYDPATDTFTATGSMINARLGHTATTLGDGSVLVAGGDHAAGATDYTPALALMERYLPESGTFVSAGSMETRRIFHAAAALANGSAFIVGGFGQGAMTGGTGEVYAANEAPALTTTTLPDGRVGVSYPATTLAARGGAGAPYQILNIGGGLPPGISYDPATFTLSGRPTADGAYAAAFKVIDSAAFSNVQTLTINVGAVNAITSPYRLIDAALYRPYDIQLTATGVTPVVWSLAPGSAPLPPGLTLSGTGRIAGTPTATGFFNFAMRAVDATGRSAFKSLSIFVREPLQITTTSPLSEGVLFQFYFSCLLADQGSGSRTWTVSNGMLPAGMTLQPGGCLSGQINALGSFSFTAQVTDESSPPQVDARTFTVDVSTAPDQGTGWDSFQPALSFGGTVRIAERVLTGVTGPLKGVQIFGLSCPVGTTVTAQIQGLTPSGTPDNSILASGSAPFGYTFANATLTIPLANPVSFSADAAFALVFLADGTCQVHPQSFNGYFAGDAYVSSSTSWQTLRSVDGRYDIPFQTLIAPPQALAYISVYRGAHTATVLADGRVLIAGSNTPTAEIYDPATGASTPTGSMSVARRDLTATLLDDGTVLIAGGWDQDANTYLSSAEIFHPDSGTFELLPAAMSTSRAVHTATKLADGSVLIAGGQSGSCCSTDLATAEIFNPGSRSFTATAPMHAQRRNHTATLLPDGRVLVAGGWGTGFGSAEIFDPATQTFGTQLSMPVRSQHTATRLTDGRVLLAGGAGDLGNALTSADIFDPAAGTFTATPPMAMPHVFATATLLDDGSVLVAGGQTENVCCDVYSPRPAMERYVPGSNSWVGAGSLLVSRYFHTASRLPNGQVLFTGTFGSSAIGGRTVEIYDPATAVSLVDATPLSGRTGIVYPGFSFAGQGGSGGPYTITHSAGALPPGLTYDSASHDLFGTPTASGTFTPTFTVEDASGHRNAQTVTIAIDPLEITTALFLPTASFGRTYSTTLSATGVGALTWTLVAGSLPPGLSLIGNEITGTPTVSCCFYGFTLRATDAVGQHATRAVGISVTAPLTITTFSLADAVAPAGYFGCLQASGGTFGRTWTVADGMLPPDVVLNAFGCFQGDVIKTGTYSFSVTASDAAGPSPPAALTIRSGTVDQAEWSIDQSVDAPTLSFGGPIAVAQVFTPQINGELLAMQMPVACTSGGLTLEIRGVDSGLPNGTVYASQPVAADLLTPFAGGFSFHRQLQLAAPLFVARGIPLAAVLTSPDSCAISQAVANEPFGSYAFGNGYTGSAGAWTPLDPSRPDLPFHAVINDGGGFPFITQWGRNNGTATLLDSNLVLLVGGFTNTTALFNPTTAPINGVAPGHVALGPNLPFGLSHHTATKLRDGWVLIAGGFNTDVQQGVATSSLYDPSTGTFVNLPPMTSPRFTHTATALPNGDVLIVGGHEIDFASPSLATTEIFHYDAGAHSGTFTPGPSLNAGRSEASAALLSDGRVLVIGGWGVPDQYAAEIVDGNTVTVGGPMAANRVVHTSTVLECATPAPCWYSGMVLVAGGIRSDNSGMVTVDELFDPSTNTFTTIGTRAPRARHIATRLGNGDVLLAGGTSDNIDALATTERFTPDATAFTAANDLIVPRRDTSAVHLPGDTVLIVGGSGPSAAVWASGEVFDAAIDSGMAGVVNQPFSQRVPAPGLTAFEYTVAVRVGAVPNGLTIDAATGVISGVPMTAGVSRLVVEIVTSVPGRRTFREVTITIDAPIAVATSALPNAQIAVAYRTRLVATGGAGGRTWSVIDGFLPSGLFLSNDGVISGAPTSSGSFSFVVRVVDASGGAAQATLTLVVDPNPNQPDAPAPNEFNNAGPGAFAVSFFNPAPTGDPASLASFGVTAAISFFNPAAVPSVETPPTQTAAAFAVSFVNGANPEPPSLTPTSSSAAAAAVSFVNGDNPTPPSLTPMASSAAAAAVSFANGSNPDLSGAAGSTGDGNRVDVVTVAAGPTITDVSPKTVSISGASPALVLTGANFANITTIAFDDPTGILVGAFAVSADAHTVTIPLILDPATPPRTVAVVVSGSDGASIVTSATVFTLVP